jgi:hypothetical protein
MAFEHEQKQALHLLDIVEQGTKTPAEAGRLLQDADPTLVYFIFTWLRERYPASHPAAEGVIGRLGEICEQYPGVTRQVKEGEADSVVTWFEDAYAYRDLDSRQFIELVVEKLEG